MVRETGTQQAYFCTIDMWTDYQIQVEIWKKKWFQMINPFKVFKCPERCNNKCVERWVFLLEIVIKIVKKYEWEYLCEERRMMMMTDDRTENLCDCFVNECKSLNNCKIHKKRYRVEIEMMMIWFFFAESSWSGKQNKRLFDWLTHFIFFSIFDVSLLCM